MQDPPELPGSRAERKDSPEVICAATPLLCPWVKQLGDRLPRANTGPEQLLSSSPLPSTLQAARGHLLPTATHAPHLPATLRPTALSTTQLATLIATPAPCPRGRALTIPTAGQRHAQAPALQPCSLPGRGNSWAVKKTRVWVSVTQGKVDMFPALRQTKVSGNAQGELQVALRCRQMLTAG